MVEWKNGEERDSNVESSYDKTIWVSEFLQYARKM